jgi:ABC-type dipeptide/oligopeptide/nickel transport system ATPase subunit
MPNFELVKEHTPTESFRVASVIGRFDLQSSHVTEKFAGAIPIENMDWNVGVIYGASGTGKSTIAKHLFPDNYFNGFEYTHDSILDDMPSGYKPDDITALFNAVGFSSPPSWLKPYDVLSNGEKMRVDLARAILENHELIVFDEFTSVVDRNVAQIGSYALQKAIRRMGKRFVAVSCHKDILDWLEPDWAFCTNDMTFTHVKKNDQPSTLKSVKRMDTGNYLANIII